MHRTTLKIKPKLRIEILLRKSEIVEISEKNTDSAFAEKDWESETEINLKKLRQS